ncbi:hypothetical protein TWF730_010596 [Orbilia blumenaviensis]|uniref:Uncharacterized protein n=1 Tax=Orbilia blumenaviensis TaxID=1796055 RepID=A0AAV9UUZ6_9PEZI
MHIPFATLVVLPLTVSAAAVDPKIFARKKPGFCDIRGIDRYVNNIATSASSSVKSWCSAQTVVANGTANYFATVTVTDDRGSNGGGWRVTKTRTTRTQTKTYSRHSRTRTVTVRRRTKTSSATTTTTSSPGLAGRAVATPAAAAGKYEEEEEFEPIGGNPIKRSDAKGPFLDYSPVSKNTGSNRGGKPSSWSSLPDTMIQALCDCLDSPWSTKNGTWTRTNRYTRTWTRTGTKAGTTTTTTVDVDATTTKTVDVTGEATVTVTTE